MSDSDSDSKELKRVVERLLRKNNDTLIDLSRHILPRIAGQFWAAGLIDKDVKDSMLETGDRVTLAAKLFSACHAPLVLDPREKFPEFIEVLKEHETMKRLAENMESEFEQAREA